MGVVLFQKSSLCDPVRISVIDPDGKSPVFR
jgi:hypothetical protein